MKYTNSKSRMREMKQMCEKGGLSHEYIRTKMYNMGMVTSDTFLKSDLVEIEKGGYEPFENLKCSIDGRFPDDLKYRETCHDGKKCGYIKAFIIEEFFLLKENFDERNFLRFYNIYTQNNYKKKENCKDDALGSIVGQNDTSCIVLKKEFCKEHIIKHISNDTGDNLEDVETNYIVAKLKKPYFVKLKKDEDMKPRERK